MTTITTTEQAVSAVLRLIRSPLVDTSGERDMWNMLSELDEKAAMLSSGENVLFEIARGLWRGTGGASVADIGLLDKQTRAALLATLTVFYTEVIG